MGKKVVEKFWDLKFIRMPQDIFKLDYERIGNLDGWGKLSVSNLKYAINNSKKVTLEKFIFSLGIRHIGQENAKLLAENLKTVENLLNLSNSYDFETFLNIDGIGETQVKSLKKFFSNKENIKIIIELKEYLKISKFEEIKGGKLRNQTFLFTGKLSDMSRAEAKTLVEKNSGKILSSVNNKLDYLVIGEKPTSKKVKIAKELNIKIINQNDFEKKIK